MKFHSSVRTVAAAALTVGIGLVAFGGVASAAPPAGPPVGPPIGPPPPPAHADGHALFLETDAPAGNQVLSYRVGSDGTLSFVDSYNTNGLGGTASGATADPLASQGGLALIDNGSDLVATNPGSNTISVFGVSGTHLRFIEQIFSGGLFPVSIATSGRFVAVLNAGGAGSVAEFASVGPVLTPIPNETRSLELSNTNPPEFHHGAGEVAFTPNGQHLIVTTKLSTNAYDVFSVARDGTLGASPVVTTSNTVLPFSFTFDGAGNVVATEAATSSVSDYRVNNDGTLTSLGSVSDGQVALCWISGVTGYFYGSNAGSGTVSEFVENAAGAPQLVNAVAATAHAGTTDSVVSPSGQFLYVESGGAGTIDAFAIGAAGALTPVETIFNIPVGSEGIAID